MTTLLRKDAMLSLGHQLFTGTRYPTVIIKVTKACTFCIINNLLPSQMGHLTHSGRYWGCLLFSSPLGEDLPLTRLS